MADIVSSATKAFLHSSAMKSYERDMMSGVIKKMAHSAGEKSAWGGALAGEAVKSRAARSAYFEYVAKGGASTASTASAEATKQTWGKFLKDSGSSALKTVTTSEGRERLASHMIHGAIIGGGIGGTAEWAQGGSFWEGAKGGAMTGAMIGGLGSVAGNVARGINPSASGVKGTASTISKQLKSVWQENDTANMARNFVTRKKG